MASVVSASAAVNYDSPENVIILEFVSDFEIRISNL